MFSPCSEHGPPERVQRTFRTPPPPCSGVLRPSHPDGVDTSSHVSVACFARRKQWFLQARNACMRMYSDETRCRARWYYCLYIILRSLDISPCSSAIASFVVALGRVQYTGHSCIALACPICTGGTSAGRRRGFVQRLLFISQKQTI